MTATPPAGRRFVAPSLLTDLLGDGLAAGLDPGYAEAATRRAARERHGTHARRGHRSDRVFGALAVVVAVVAGVVLAVGWNEAHADAPASAALHEQLVARARAAASDADGLEKAVTSAAARVAALQDSALSGDAAGQAARAQLTAAQVAAGTVAVSGPGLKVTLADPSAADPNPAGGRAGSTPIGEVRVVSDLDIRDLVNVLWAAGAEAVAVNQVRITPLSAIRFAGSDVLVDLRVVSSPYTVSAVGDAARLQVAFAQSGVAGRFATYRANRGVSFEFTTEDDLSLPAGVLADPRYASVAPSTTPTPTGAPSAPTAPPTADPTAGRPS